MVLKIRKVDAYNTCYPVYVDISRIVAIEEVESTKENSNIKTKYNTFKVYFECAVWDVLIDDYGPLCEAWMRIVNKNFSKK